jgi:hypothetical protein
MSYEIKDDLTIYSLTITSAKATRLDDFASLTPTDGGFPVGDGSNFVLETGDTVRASLNLEYYSATATIDFGSLGTDGTATDTITVTGAETGDTVILQPQQIDSVALFGHVSSSDTVTVTAINHTAGTVDPASTSIRATAIKFQ